MPDALKPAPILRAHHCPKSVMTKPSHIPQHITHIVTAPKHQYVLLEQRRLNGRMVTQVIGSYHSPQSVWVVSRQPDLALESASSRAIATTALAANLVESLRKEYGICPPS